MGYSSIKNHDPMVPVVLSPRRAPPRTRVHMSPIRDSARPARSAHPAVRSARSLSPWSIFRSMTNAPGSAMRIQKAVAGVRGQS